MAGRKRNHDVVLVVEDDPDWQRKLADIIKELDYDVEIAGTIEEARNLFAQRKRFSALTVDIKLGKEDHPEGLHLLSALEFLESTKRSSQGDAIVVSAYKSYEERAIEKGAIAFFNKAAFSDDLDKFRSTLEDVVKKNSAKISLQTEFDNLLLIGKHVEILVPVGITNPWSKHMKDS